MNIFAVSDDLTLCAQALDDKRLNKMLIETGQLLSAARILMGKPAPYKISHAHHTATKWAVSRFQHRCWLGALGCAYYEEYRLRFGKTQHGAWDNCGDLFVKYRDRLDPLFDIQYVNCARNKELGIDFTHIKNVRVAYRNYLCARWRIALEENNPKKVPSFTNRKPPTFSGWLAVQMEIK